MYLYWWICNCIVDMCICTSVEYCTCVGIPWTRVLYHLCCICISVTNACNSVDNIIFVHVLVLIFVQVPFYSPLPRLHNRHYTLYHLGFVVAAGSALRPLTVFRLALNAVICYFFAYMCACVY